MSADSRTPSARGFTLVELLVAMAAGLMVALAVVTLSREANNTFHEETRIASAEMQLRTAIDRIRADLQRASYMSTGNIWIDPGIATKPGGATPVSPIDLSVYNNATHMSLYSLAGVRLFVGGSNGLSMPFATVNGLNPDAFELAGNFTSVEELPIGGATGTVAIQPAPAGICQGQRVFINVGASPSVWRSIGYGVGSPDAGDAGPSSADQAILNVFQPVNDGYTDAGAQANPAFIVRVVDQAGKAQYVSTCAGSHTAAWNNGQPYVDIDSRTPIQTAAQIGGGAGFAGLGGGGGTINPVQIVRWEIMPSYTDHCVTMCVPGNADSAKYDLTRTFLDAFGNAASSPEVIAEYAVDLKLAFTTDSSSSTTGNAATTTECIFPFEDGSLNRNGVAASVVTASATNGSISCTPTNAMPQRIRSIRYRIATRAAQMDRTAPLAPPNTSDYVFRYCANAAGDGGASCTPGTQAWARTRTIISEVALPNQASMWFP